MTNEDLEDWIEEQHPKGTIDWYKEYVRLLNAVEVATNNTTDYGPHMVALSILMDMGFYMVKTRGKG